MISICMTFCLEVDVQPIMYIAYRESDRMGKMLPKEFVSCKEKRVLETSSQQLPHVPYHEVIHCLVNYCQHEPNYMLCKEIESLKDKKVSKTIIISPDESRGYTGFSMVAPPAPPE